MITGEVLIATSFQPGALREGGLSVPSDPSLKTSARKFLSKVKDDSGKAEKAFDKIEKTFNTTVRMPLM